MIICAIFSEFLIKLAGAYRFPYRSPKLRLDLQSQKTISLLITITISLNIQIDKFVYHSDLETTIVAYFRAKSLNYTVINLFLQKLSTLTIVNFTISTRTDITLQTSVIYLRAITMCSGFTPDCGYNNSTIILIGDVGCPNTKCSGRLCLHKTLFNHLAEAIIKVRNVGLCARCAIFLLKIKEDPFSCRLVKGFTLFKRTQNQLKMLLEVFCPGKHCSNREKCESLGGYVTTPRSFYACGKCGAWLFVHKIPFMLQEHVKTTKTDKTRFFFVKKKMNLVPNKQLLLNVPFQSTNYRKKELCVDNKVRETIGYVYCPTCGIEKCVYISINKTTNFYDCKKCKTCCNVLNILFKDQKSTIRLFGGDGTHCFARKTIRDYEKEKPSPFLKRFLRQSQPSTSEPEPKKVKMSPNME